MFERSGIRARERRGVELGRRRFNKDLSPARIGRASADRASLYPPCLVNGGLQQGNLHAATEHLLGNISGVTGDAAWTASRRHRCHGT